MNLETLIHSNIASVYVSLEVQLRHTKNICFRRESEKNIQFVSPITTKSA